MTDGLEALEQTRQPRPGRTIPPPRHKARPAPAVSQPDQPAQAPAGSAPDRPAPAPSPASAARPARAARSRRQPAVDDKASPATIYLGSAQADYLNEVYIAGLLQKVDASKSAVARLAIDRLAEQLTPEQIIGMLQDKPPANPRGGRPRK